MSARVERIDRAPRVGGPLARWWFAPAPAERLAALRIAIGGFAVIWTAARLPELVGLAGLPAAQFAPVGVIRAIAAPLPPALVSGIAAATLVLRVAFTAGWRYRVTAPLAALGLLWTISYRNAWGMVFHTENLVVLHVIALACLPAADAWSLDRRTALPFGSRPRAAPPAGYGWAVKLLAALTCATYLLAGIAKLRIAGLAWLDGEQLRNQIAVDNLRKAVLGAATAPLARLFVVHPDGLIGLSVLTLAIELGAPLALLGRRIAWLWLWGAWAFHAGVVLSMNVWFPYPLVGVAFLPLARPERAIAWLLARRESRRRSRGYERGARQ